MCEVTRDNVLTHAASAAWRAAVASAPTLHLRKSRHAAPVGR
jgi:hypothetical protein